MKIILIVEIVYNILCVNWSKLVLKLINVKKIGKRFHKKKGKKRFTLAIKSNIL